MPSPPFTPALPEAIADEAFARGFIQTASHQGDLFRCAVALANLDAVVEGDLLANAVRMGRLLGDGLAELARRFESVGEARGVGFLWVLEIVRDPGTREEAPDLAARITVECLRRGLIVAGLRPGIREVNVLRLALPLVVSQDEIERARSSRRQSRRL